jgi:hypothetical protein
MSGVFEQATSGRGSIKWVASAVGGDATAVRLVHEHLRADDL